MRSCYFQELVENISMWWPQIKLYMNRAVFSDPRIFTTWQPMIQCNLIFISTQNAWYLHGRSANKQKQLYWNKSELL